jgi:hypothetical protein
MISLLATTSLAVVVIFLSRSPTGANASFSSIMLMRSAVCKAISAIAVPPGSLGSAAHPNQMQRPCSQALADSLPVTRKYFAVVAGMVIRLL